MYDQHFFEQKMDEDFFLTVIDETKCDTLLENRLIAASTYFGETGKMVKYRDCEGIVRLYHPTQEVLDNRESRIVSMASTNAIVSQNKWSLIGYLLFVFWAAVYGIYYCKKNETS